ncbi:TetR/AcrR family transcriptional regulator [Paenibacillus albidus]|uniref:TetR/AcrR family transcriptional regulator n=1 Tax=Paenibacillus albidus TaxID=2041023 RepID=UPI001BE5C0AC|nr:TetR/AcrR family transcriptional regulator [Paenibacillus albidus]MBT2290126.1 TetR/AcrR family transcriptional regulator [Paenibacillus albidus]
MVRPRNFDEIDVLRKAMTLFWTKGYEMTSLNDLLNVTGLSKSSLYETFGNKHDLFLRAFDLYRLERLSYLLNYLSNENVYRGIELFFMALLNKVSKGCMTSNEAIELAPHDKEFQKVIEKDFEDIENAFFNAIEIGKINGSIQSEIDSLKLARFLTVSLQGVNVMVRAQTSQDRIKDFLSVILGNLK